MKRRWTIAVNKCILRAKWSCTVSSALGLAENGGSRRVARFRAANVRTRFRGARLTTRQLPPAPTVIPTLVAGIGTGSHRDFSEARCQPNPKKTMTLTFFEL